MNIDKHINRITPGNPCKPNFYRNLAEMLLRGAYVEQRFHKYCQIKTPNMPPNPSC